MYHLLEKSKTEGARIRVGITHGDLNGIGYEIIMKTFLDQRMLELFTPIVYGSSKVASYHRKTLNFNDFNFNLVKSASMASPRRANIVNVFHDEVKIDLGKSTQVAGELAHLALEAATRDLKNNYIDVLVTAPINKKNIQSEHFRYPGHSEYLAEKFEVKDYLMLMVCDDLRVGVITGHIPIREISENLTIDVILKKIEVLNHSLIRDFAIRRPKIALLGLNPHAGDGGLLGKEDEEIISPAIEKAKEKNILAFGPYPADGFFGSRGYRNFDGVLAMYHDQGMVPFKALSFERGVNFTAGLPIVRTSPAHGTAYEIAGKNEASPDSFREAIFLAYEIFQNRQMHEELTGHPLPNYLKELESGSDAVIEAEVPSQPEENPENIIIDESALN
jgi:4-hydroxythreonine-4-phosphate dehydrogenase